MKLTVLALLMLLTFPLPSISLYSDGSGGKLSGNDFAISLYDGSVYMDTGILAYGAVAKLGLVSFLSSPHSSDWDLRPRAVSPSGYSSSQSGALLNAGPLTLGSTADGRPEVFASLSGEYLEGAILFAEGEGDDGSLQNEPGTGTEDDTLYLAMTGGIGFVSLLGVLSFVPGYGLLPMGGVRLGHGDYSLSFTYGDIFDLDDSDPSYTWGLRLTLGEEGFYASFSYAEGLSPVYAEDYLRKALSIDVSLEIPGMILSSSMDYSRSRKGTISKSNYFTLKTDVLSVGWDSDDGLSWECSFEHIAIGFEDGAMYVRLSLLLGGPDAKARLGLRLGEKASISLSFSP